MATTLIVPTESFHHPAENSRLPPYSWLTVIEDMERFYQTKQQDCWSRNFRWPQRNSETNHQLSPAGVSSVYSVCVTTSNGTKVSPSSSSRSKLQRDHREGPYGQGVTLRPEDLLISSSNSLPLSPYSVYEWSNTLAQNAGQRINPSAYLQPSVQEARHGSRRFVLGGSASELHATIPQAHLPRRRSEGNYERYDLEPNQDLNREAKAPTGSSPSRKKSSKSSRVSQDGFDTSDSSISSSFAGRSAYRDFRDAPTSSYTAAAAPDGDTFSSTSSTSAVDNAPTSATSTGESSSSAVSTPASPSSDDSSRRCRYCRLSTSDSSDSCCCRCYRERSASPCSCCGSPATTEVVIRKSARLSERKQGSRDVSKSPATRSQIASEEANYARRRIAKQSTVPPQRYHETHRSPGKTRDNARKLAKATSYIDDAPVSGYAVSKQKVGTSPSKTHREKAMVLLPAVSTQRPNNRSRRSHAESFGNAAQFSYSFSEGKGSKPDNSSLQDPRSDTMTRGKSFSPRRKSSASTTVVESSSRHRQRKSPTMPRSPAKTRRRHVENDYDTSDQINLRVYSPNLLSRRVLMSNEYRLRARSLHRTDDAKPRVVDSSVDDDVSRRVTYRKLGYVELTNESDWSPRRRRLNYSSSLSTDAVDTRKRDADVSKDVSRDFDHRRGSGAAARSTPDPEYIYTVNKPVSLKKFKDSSLEYVNSDLSKSSKTTSVKPTEIAYAEDVGTPRNDENRRETTVTLGEGSPHKRRSERKASKILHTKVTLVRRELPYSKFQKAGADDSENSTPPDKPPVGEYFGGRDDANPGRQNAPEKIDDRESGNRGAVEADATRTSDSFVIEVPADVLGEESDKGSFSSNATVRTARVVTSSSSVRSEIAVAIPDDPGGDGDPDTITKAADATPTPPFTAIADVELGERTSAASVRRKQKSRSASSDSVDEFSHASSGSKQRSVARQKSDDLREIAVRRRSSSVRQGSKTDSQQEEKSFRCSSDTCACEESTPSAPEEGGKEVVSEEECSLCQREKRQMRALSPKVLIMRASPTKELEETPPDMSGKDLGKTVVASPSSTPPKTTAKDLLKSSPTKTQSLEGPPKPKSKSPDYLTADFPFEPEIIHKANPLVDEAEDEECQRRLGSPFRRLSEEEFVATLSIHDAAGKGDLHVIKLLVKKDRKQMETVDERGWTPIHIAAAKGHVDIVKYLSQEGAHLAALDPSSYTAIHLAAMNGHNSCVEVLLHRGVDVDCVTAEGFTPLHLAAMNAHVECCQTLLHWGASLEKKDSLGRKVEDMIEEYGLVEVAELIARFRRQLKRFQDILKMIQPKDMESWGDSLVASLSRLKESEIPKEILDMLASLSEESGPE